MRGAQECAFLKQENRDFELISSSQKKQWSEELQIKSQECMEQTVRNNNLRNELDQLRGVEQKYKGASLIQSATRSGCCCTRRTCA